MQSEEFDKKLKEAAERHHPAYDEQAWIKMNSLLNKHMPEEKDNRKRFIFFLLLFLLTGGGAMLILNTNHSKTKKEVTVVKNGLAETVEKEQLQQNNTATEQENKKPAVDKIPTTKEANITSGSTLKPIKISPQLYQDALQNTLIQNRKKTATITKDRNGSTGDQMDAEVSAMNNNNNTPGEKNKASNYSPAAIGITDPAKPDAAKLHDTPGNKKEESTEKPNHTALPADKENNPQPLAAETAAKNKRTKSFRKSNFFVSLSSSADVSFAAGEQAGKMKLLSGAGAGFIFKNRFMVRTGFYSGRKIYEASPDAYNPPATFWTYYPYLQKVEADCKVYEIPLLLSYQFGNSSKENWFATTGISSYLMKREAYTYYYKQTPAGSVYKRNWTINNENDHLFSVLTFSGGYQRKLSDKFFIMAEPYFKLPLSGVGFGKVKLNSAGLQFTAGFIPFEKKKNTASVK